VLWRERVWIELSWLRIGNHDGPCETKVNIMAVKKRRISRLAENGPHNFTHNINQYLLIKAVTRMETSISHTSSMDMRPPQGHIKELASRAAAPDATTSLE
jgi:hypothetical protein